jgi:hypothetical protein
MCTADPLKNRLFFAGVTMCQGSSRAIRFVHIERPLSLLIAQKPPFRSAKLGRGGSITILTRIADARPLCAQ